MDAADRGQQLSEAAAEVYEEFFLPALFQQWAEPVVEAAQISEGDWVLDVACGTGVVARTAKRRAGTAGRVVGVDINDGMLAVARSRAPDIEWRQAPAESLPFEAEVFDAVVCQFGLMFFTDREKSLREMQRVLRPGGRLVIAVWSSLHTSPGYAAMVKLLGDLFDDEVADALRAPFALGEKRTLSALLSRADLPAAVIRTREGQATFPSIASWVRTDIKGWTLADRIDGAGFAMLAAAAETALTRFKSADGRVRFDAPAHLVVVTRPQLS